MLILLQPDPNALQHWERLNSADPGGSYFVFANQFGHHTESADRYGKLLIL